MNSPKAALIDSARTALSARRFEAAHRAAMTVLQQHGPDAEAFFVLAMIAVEHGNPGKAAEVLDRFIAGLGLPRRLRDVGVKRDDLQRIATNCMKDDWTFSNPRTINGAQEIVPILESVY